MPTQEHECKQCKAMFSESESDSPKSEVELKCPECGSPDTMSVNDCCSIFDQLRNMMASGGG